MNMTHRPRGSMCLACKNLTATELGFQRNKCPSTEDFTKMRPIDKDSDGTIVVRCDRFERNNNAEKAKQKDPWH